MIDIFIIFYCNLLKQTHLFVFIFLFFRRLSQQNKPDFEVHFSDNKQTDLSQKSNPGEQGRHNNDTGTCAATYSTVNTPNVRKTSQTRLNPQQIAVITPIANGKVFDRQTNNMTLCGDNYHDVFAPSDFDDYDCIHKPANTKSTDAYDTFNNSSNVYNTTNNPNNSTPNKNVTINDYSSSKEFTDEVNYNTTAISPERAVMDNTYNSFQENKEVENEYNVTNVNRKTDVHKDATYDRLDSKT